MVVLPSRDLFPSMCIRPFLADEFLQFSFSDEGLNLLFQIVAIRSIVTVVTVERQYLFLDRLVGSLFNFPGNVRAHSSLICIST